MPENIALQKDRQQLIELINRNFPEGALFISATYTKDEMPDTRGKAVSDISDFIRKLSERAKKPFKYVRITDSDKRGYKHKVITNFNDIGVIKELWQHGYYNFTRISAGNVLNAARYIAAISGPERTCSHGTEVIGKLDTAENQRVLHGNPATK